LKQIYVFEHHTSPPVPTLLLVGADYALRSFSH